MNGLIGTIYGFGNVFLMMWYGYGGAEVVPTPQSVPVIAAIYLFLVILAVYLPLWATNEGARKAAIIGLLPPWVFVMLIALPQKEAPEMLVFCGSIVAVLLFTRRPIEKFIQSTKA